MEGTVLIADDDRTIRTVLSQALSRAGCQVHATSSLTTLLRWVGEGRGDLVITDVMMPDGNGLEMLPKIAQDRPGLPVIVISAQNSIMTAIRAEQAKAHDYIPKPFDLPDLLKRASKALEATPEKKPKSTASAPTTEGEELALIGRAPAMQQIYARVARLLSARTPLAITGPSGSGKTLLAETLHNASDHRDDPLILVSPDDLATVEEAKRVVARARGGLLLIDEVESFDDAAQLWLRRRIDMADAQGPRLVLTAQTPLASLVAEGRLRSDLGYRLSADEIRLPPLTERLEDIEPLAAHFLARCEGRAATLTPTALEMLRAAPWPGNVRQLDAVLQIAARDAEGGSIGSEAVSRALGQLSGAVGASPAMVPAGELAPAAPQPAPTGETLGEAVHRHLSHYFDRHGDELPPPGLYARVLREIEQPLLSLSLDALSGNQAKAADLLGINRNTLRKKLNDLGMEVTRSRKLM